MKCLTICQPYARLIVIGQKRVENRTWPTRYRGPLLIHAGVNRAWMDESEAQAAQRFGEPLVFGAVVGRAELVGCVDITYVRQLMVDQALCQSSRWHWLPEHEHANGPWCWVLENVERFAVPVPMKGRQGLFDVDDALMAKAAVESPA